MKETAQTGAEKMSCFFNTEIFSQDQVTVDTEQVLQ